MDFFYILNKNQFPEWLELVTRFFKHLEMVIKQIKYINRAKNEDYIEKTEYFWNKVIFEIIFFLQSKL